MREYEYKLNDGWKFFGHDSDTILIKRDKYQRRTEIYWIYHTGNEKQLPAWGVTRDKFMNLKLLNN